MHLASVMRISQDCLKHCHSTRHGISISVMQVKSDKQSSSRPISPTSPRISESIRDGDLILVAQFF